MKHLIIFAIASIGFSAFGQRTTLEYQPLNIDWLPYRKAGEFTSLYDTTVLFKGKMCDKCWHVHDWKYENKDFASVQSCAVNHGATGYPDTWLNQKRICTKCLRHEQIKETRLTVPVKDEYTEAVERLNKQN